MKRTHLFIIVAISLLTIACNKEELYTPYDGGTNRVSGRADFSYSIQQPLKIIISDESQGSVVEYDFGDGTIIRYTPKQEIVHQYSLSGTYIVKARAIGTDKSEHEKHASVEIPTPSVYISGVRYNQISHQDQYYKLIMRDANNNKIHETAYTQEILYNQILPKTYTFQNPVLLKDEAYCYIYTSNKRSGGSQEEVLEDEISILLLAISYYPNSYRLMSTWTYTQADLLLDYR